VRLISPVWSNQIRIADQSRVTIESLLDDVLLDIFYFYQRGPYGYSPHRWRIVVHVCRRWRYVVFSFPRRLDLYLECNANIGVRGTMDVWPCLPIVIRDTRTTKWPVFFGDNIIAALECHDRVCEIELYHLTHPLLEQFSRVMQVPFPALTSLKLGFGDKSLVPPPVLDAFLGGSAPRLQCLILGGIPVPILPKLLPSCHDLVQVQLTRIPHTGYISPEAMATSLSALAKLEALDIGFESPASRPHRRPLPSTRVILPALTRLEFHGDSEYFEDLVARIDTPSIISVKTKFFNPLIFDNPQFLQFLGRTKVLRSFKQVKLFLDKSMADISLHNDHHHSPVNPGANLHIHISCDGLDWQLSGLAQICEQFSTVLFNVGRCNVDWSRNWAVPREDTDHTQWLELFRPFTSVHSLEISSGMEVLISPALGELTGDRVMEVLPVLRTFFFSRLRVKKSPNPFLPFFRARRRSKNPVTFKNRSLSPSPRPQRKLPWQSSDDSSNPSPFFASPLSVGPPITGGPAPPAPT
jgi:hypothetical protein